MVGLSSVLVFIGLKIDSVKWELHLLLPKLLHLKGTILQWLSKRSATKHQFKVLLGQLNHVASVVPTSQILHVRSLMQCGPHRKPLIVQLHREQIQYSMFVLFSQSLDHSSHIYHMGLWFCLMHLVPGAVDLSCLFHTSRSSSNGP